MRRARIKAVAAVPIRKKPVQDTLTPSETNGVSDTEQKKEVCDSETIKTAVGDVVEVQEKDLPDTDVSEEKADVTNVPKEIVEDTLAEINVNVKKSASQETSEGDCEKTCVKPALAEPCMEIKEEVSSSKEWCVEIKESSQELSPRKTDSQESCVKIKPDSQELCLQTEQSSQAVDAEAKSSSSGPRCVGVNNSEKRGVHAEQERVSPDMPAGTEIVSPVKVIQNRPCFMRPIPRLDSGGRIRKNSVQGSGASASESEDEHGKRTVPLTPSRIRNDSICSVQSNKESVVNDNPPNSPRMRATQKRRMLISESARKLAEARREFLLRHENKTPDRNKLKMYDLIYYNPITNPMKKPRIETPTNAGKSALPQSTGLPEEEDEDDPVAMPVPQVKVGPDGQLIIDEQSLVIEASTVKRNTKEILTTDVVVEDENCHGGFYKKRQRGKDWPKWETFKFYRVLNVVGTDFSLMKTYFPNRTRQEIKQKYKKEERVNRQLIEKALKYPQEFDTEMLEKQLAKLQRLENIENTPKKVSEKPKNEPRMTKAARKRRRRLVAKSIGECETSSVNDQDENGDDVDSEASVETSDTRPSQVKRGSKSRRFKRLDTSDKSDDNSSRASSKESDSDSEPEIYQIRPTRSGRLPKMKKFYHNILPESDDEDVSLANMIATSSSSQEAAEIMNAPDDSGGDVVTTSSQDLATVIPNISDIEPGSLVIVSRESEDSGKTILQVYMVSSNVDTASADDAVKRDVTPVDLPPTLLTTVTDRLEEAESINMSNDCE